VLCLTILVSVVLVLSCGQTDRQTDRITEADDRYTHATTAGVSNDIRYETRSVNIGQWVNLALTSSSLSLLLRPIAAASSNLFNDVTSADFNSSSLLSLATPDGITRLP